MKINWISGITSNLESTSQYDELHGMNVIECDTVELFISVEVGCDSYAVVGG